MTFICFFAYFLFSNRFTMNIFGRKLTNDRFFFFGLWICKTDTIIIFAPGDLDPAPLTTHTTVHDRDTVFTVHRSFIFHFSVCFNRFRYILYALRESPSWNRRAAQCLATIMCSQKIYKCPQCEIRKIFNCRHTLKYLPIHYTFYLKMIENTFFVSR